MTFPTMIGTTGSKFTVVGVYGNGHIGFRDISSEEGEGKFRVRIAEFSSKESLAALLPSWKQPGYGANVRRFSTVVTGQEALLEAISTGTAALAATSNGVAPSAPTPLPALAAKIADAEAKLEAAQTAIDAAHEEYDEANEELDNLLALQDQLQEALA